jgi:predicted  nucleic acid-binding Zn-ribbon protein
MQVITTDQMTILVKLQSIEIETDKIRKKLGDVAEKLKKLDDETQDFEQSISDTDTHLGVLKKESRENERDAEQNLSRVKKSDEKLRAVKTNKEYQSILKEIEDIKTLNSQIEDRMIESLDEIEAAEQSVMQKKADYDLLKDQISDEKGTIQRESEAGKARLTRLESDWKDISERIDPGLMKTYMAVRENRGTAVAAANNATCQGCNLNIPQQMYNELQRCDSLTFCPHCQRIIYWENSVE